MLHYYDEPPEAVEYQIIRLAPTRPVIEAGIPCVVWAEDALSFAHFVPFDLISFEILVPDELLDRACEAICKALPYRRMTAPPDDWINYKYHDPNEGLWTTTSIPLELTSDSKGHPDLPPRVHIHPQSLYSFDVRDHNLSLAFPERYPTPLHLVRFPTLAAFADASIATLLDPPCGSFHMKMCRVMRMYVAYIVQYTFKESLRSEDGTLLPGPRALLQSLREENRLFLEATMAETKKRPDWMVEAKKRRDILENLGRPTRPLPIDFRWPDLAYFKNREFHTSAQQSTGAQVDFASSQPRLFRPRQPPAMSRGMLLSTARNLVRRIT